MRTFAILVTSAVCGLTVGHAASAAAAEEAATPAPRLILQPCRVKGFEIEMHCAKLSVFENRETRAGRKIDIHVAVLKAKSDRKKSDPVFVFAGGPGQSAIEVGSRVMGALGKLNRERDLVFIDQRGTGQSNRLACKVEDTDSMEGFGGDAQIRQFISDCLAEAKKHADPTLYTTRIAMEDINDLRAALGYQQVNLWGASYGTRAALEFLRRFPQHTRSATLDGIAPFSIALPLSFIPDSNASLQALTKDCASQKSCAQTFPKLESDLKDLVQSLEAKPRKVKLEHPRTGQMVDLRLTGTMVLGGIRAAMYAPNVASVVPAAIKSAKNDDFRPLAALGLLISGGVYEELALGMHLSVVCSEDWPLVEVALKQAERKEGIYGRELLNDHRNMCAVWPKGKVSPDYYTPVTSNVPVLLLSGGVDPATPPRHAEAVLPGLSRGKHLVAPQIGHGVSGQGCAPELIKRFIDDGNADKVDGACLTRLPRPTFFQPMHTGSNP